MSIKDKINKDDPLLSLTIIVSSAVFLPSLWFIFKNFLIIDKDWFGFLLWTICLIFVVNPIFALIFHRSARFIWLHVIKPLRFPDTLPEDSEKLAEKKKIDVLEKSGLRRRQVYGDAAFAKKAELDRATARDKDFAPKFDR